MNDYGWKGQGSPGQPDTGIAQVLAFYAQYGGELLGARRSDNPLTLTHVRWHDDAGHIADAVHLLEADGVIGAAEREVWVQLALDLPVAAAGMFGAQAPWERLALDQNRAAEMLNQLRRSLASNPSRNNQYPGQWSPSGYAAQSPMSPMSPMQSPSPQPYPSNRMENSAGWLGQSGSPAGAYSPPMQPQSVPQSPYPPRPAPPQSGAPFNSAYPPRPGEPISAGSQGSAGMPSSEDPRGWTNAQRISQEPEVTVIPCVEVELPPVLNDPSATEQARDFTRNVAAHFNQSVRQLPQVRETRGWMRNGRMVLAARIAVAPGTRVPSHLEMENAARLLGDTLMRNVLPFTRMTFAEPGEWAQGIALPE